MAKSLIRLCESLNSLSKTPKYVGAMRFCHSKSESTELTTTTTTTLNQKSPSEAKRLFDLLSNDKNPINLIVNLEANKDKIDGRHVVTAFTSMYKFYEINKYPLGNVITSPQFTKMCNYLNKHIRTLEMPQLIQSLKILNLFKVRAKTTIVQNLLQLIRVSINDLHPHEIYYMSFLLKHMESTYLSNAIYTALPEIFEARIRTKLDVEDLVELRNALKFATNNLVSDQTIQFLLEHIDNYNGPIDTASAIQIFQSISRLEHRDGYSNILPKTSDVILKNADKLNESEVKNVIFDTCAQVLRGNEKFYDPIFLDVLINQVIKNDYGIESGFNILAKINRLRHIHLPLLQYLTVQLQNNPYAFVKSPITMSILLQGLADSNFKPPNWHILREEIFNNYNKLPDHVVIAYLALYTAALDDFDLRTIEHVFTMDQHPDQLKSSYHQTLCELYQIVKTLYPEYTGPWPTDEILNTFKNFKFQYKPTNYLLKSILENLLQDPACLKTDVRTHLGHNIDYLVVLRNGSAIPIESNVTSEDANSNTFVEDFNIPEDCEKVAVCVLPSVVYGRNIPQPNAKTRIKRKTLKAMSFKVVFISQDTWISMPDMERIPYLQRVIGLVKKEQPDKITENSSAQLMEAST